MGGGIGGSQYLGVVFLTLFRLTQCCGGSTHIEIGHRATQYFEETTGDVNYKQLILNHQDAFQAGNPYPDAYYDSICRGGKYHDVSEDTHWAPFLNATINYVRENYPKPWDKISVAKYKDTEKLVVFMLGFVSHQVADVSWHSLGIDQGFLDTMGKVNFYGSFEAAHSVGDPGGDAVAQFELDMSYVGLVSEWYVPVNDLLAIYTDYYGNPDRMKKGIIEECTALLFLERLGEKLTMAKAFAYFGTESPFMVEDFQSYFLGGVDDMATWTTNVWREAIYMLDKGTSACDIPENPIYITCAQNDTAPTRDNAKQASKMKGLHTRLTHLQGLSLSDVNMTWTDRGVHFAPTQNLKDRIQQLYKDVKTNRTAKAKVMPDLKLTNKNATAHALYTSTNSYAMTGWSLTTGDLNQDGISDLVIGAPGYSKTNKAQNGRVYIIFGAQHGIPGNVSGKVDLDRFANVTLDGIELNGRFGMAISVVDFNKDGLVDLAVSAPSVGSPQLNYTGEVYVFLAAKGGKFSNQPNVTVQCKIHYCNFGWSLASGVDLNNDGFKDLVIGSPFASNTGNQRGVVVVIYASEKWTGMHIVTEKQVNASIAGDQDYGWFGYNVATSMVNFFGPYLLVTQPAYRLCTLQNCSYSDNDTQSIGRLVMYSATDLVNPKLVITGRQQFEKLGSMAAVGDPYQTGHSILAVGSDTEDVKGAIFGVGTNFQQAGQVKLYNLTRILMTQSNGGNPRVRHPSLHQDLDAVSVFEGDRKLGRYGQMVAVDDVTGDNIDDLIIAAPLRIDDITEELQKGEEGAVYVYSGSAKFPSGNVTRNCKALHPAVEPCPDVTASVVVSPNESGTRFGKNAVVWKQGQVTYLAVSAHRSNAGSRLSGAVHIYIIGAH